MIALENRKTRLELTPEIGGSVARLTFEGRDILRAARLGSADPEDTACFALVPFANRIGRGAFAFAGENIQLPCNSGQHSLHGHGWRSAWDVTKRAGGRVTLAFRHEPDDWPWAYVAEQTFVLMRSGFGVRLSVRNTDRRAMPLSLGFHPYFPRAKMTGLRATLGGVWLNDGNRLPVSHLDRPLCPEGAGSAVSQIVEIDNCNTGWGREAVIDMPELGLAIALRASEPLNFLHLYVPPGADFFCVEPVSAMPDAVNRREPSAITGLRTLAAGDVLAVSMTISANPFSG